MKDFSLQIEAWLLGELQGQERIDFEQALQSDPQLVHAVEQVQGMQSRLNGMHLRKKVSNALQYQQVKAPRSNFKWGWVGLIGLIILLLLFWFISGETTQAPGQPIPPPATPAPGNNPAANPSAAQEKMVPVQSSGNNDAAKAPSPAAGRPIALAREFYVPPTGQFIRDATEQESAKTPFQRAAEAFSEQNYDLACKLLQDDTQTRADESVRFLRANARFNAGQFKGAAQDFKQLETSFQHKYEARWNLLMCEIALGNARKPAVRSVLEAMVSDIDFPFNDAAKRLKKRL